MFQAFLSGQIDPGQMLEAGGDRQRPFLRPLCLIRLGRQQEALRILTELLETTRISASEENWQDFWVTFENLAQLAEDSGVLTEILSVLSSKAPGILRKVLQRSFRHPKLSVDLASTPSLYFNQATFADKPSRRLAQAHFRSDWFALQSFTTFAEHAASEKRDFWVRRHVVG